MHYYIYILYSAKADLYYIGSSQNPEERLRKHLAAHNGFTARAKDWNIFFSECCSDKVMALKREKEIKAWKSRKMIQQLIFQASLRGSDSFS